MRIIDLSHAIHQEMPVFPGTEPPQLKSANTLEKDGFVEVKLIMYSHTGTHIDAPSHMRPGGLALDQFSIEDFIGPGLVIDCTDWARSGQITRQHLQTWEAKLGQAKYLILKTGWSSYWGTNDYFRGFPTLTEEAAAWLVTHSNLRGIGVDAITVDQMDSTAFPIHHILFEQNFLVIENLCNLEQLPDEDFTFSCLPLKTQNADGSPIRAVAIMKD